MRRNGVTIVELLVAIVVIGALLAILIPAVQSAREAGRRSQCMANLKQLGIALEQYGDINRAYPPGFSFPSALLPYLELEPLYRKIDFSAAQSSPSNVAASHTSVAIFRCPTDAAAVSASGTNYAGNFGTGVQAYGYNGIIRPVNGYFGIGESLTATYLISPRSVIDGLSNTAAIGEILVADGRRDPMRMVWNTPVALAGPSQLSSFALECRSMSGTGPADLSERGVKWLFTDLLYTGYTHILTPNKNSCFNGSLVQDGAFTSTSGHPRGINLLCADGHTIFVKQDVETAVWQAFGSRNGGDVFVY
jgi:prepilin-type N-terminal cleavage/methylation domain-containing protein